MSGITATQGSTTINAAGVASFSVPQTGLVTGVVVVFTLTGATHAEYAWTAAAPEGAGNGFSSSSASAPTLNPDQAGTWNIVLQGKDADGLVEATYILPLVIVKVVNSVATGPLWPAYLDPSTVGPPSIGEALFCDSTNGGVLSTIDASGVVRELGSGGRSTAAERQATWHISAATGSNSNSGLDAAHPIRDCEERWRRCGTSYVVEQPTTIVYHDSPPASDVELFNDVMIGYGGSLTLEGIRTVVATGVLTSFTAFDRAAQTKNIIADTNLSGGFAAHLGRYMRITAGPRAGTDWVITKDLGGGSAEISTPGATSSVGLGTFTRATPQTGDAYEIVTVPSLTAGTLAFAAGSQQGQAATGFNRVIIQDLELDFGNKVSGITTDLRSGIVGHFVDPLLIRCKLDAMTSLAYPIRFFQCYHYGYVIIAAGSYASLRAGAHTSHLQTNSGGHAILDMDELFQGGQITVGRGSSIEVGTACVFDKNGQGVAINPGATLICEPIGDGVTALWGTNNATQGITINAGGGLYYWNGTGGAKPTVNAGLGSGREVLLSVTDYVYANVPAVSNNAVMGTWP